MFPSNYELSHPLDRPGQFETFKRILESKARYVLVEGPTGIGKSAWVAAGSIASQYLEDQPDLKTMVLTKTISLQESNYLESYQFHTMKGKRNYACGEHPRADAESCPNDSCKNSTCPYRSAYDTAIYSQRLSLNNAKYNSDRFLVDKHRPHIVWIDEAHLMSDEVIDLAGGTLDWSTDWWDIEPRVFFGADERAQKMGREVIREMIRQLALRKPDEFDYDDNTGQRIRTQEFIKWNRMVQKLDRMTGTQSDFFYEGLHNPKKRQSAFICKPLTAQYRFKYMFGHLGNNAQKIVLMTATMGNPEVMANELGIQDDYEYIHIQNYHPPEARQVEILKAPRLHYKASERVYEEQADIIANQIGELPESWTGVLFTTSKAAAQSLHYRLGQRGINVFVPTPGAGTARNLDEWRYARQSGRYKCTASWNFQEGVDLREDYFGFITKVAWPYLGDNFSRSRKTFAPEVYMGKAACHGEQCAGRLRRVDSDFGQGVKRIFFVDGAVNGITNHFSPTFQEALVWPDGSMGSRNTRTTTVHKPKSGPPKPRQRLVGKRPVGKKFKEAS